MKQPHMKNKREHTQTTHTTEHLFPNFGKIGAGTTRCSLQQHTKSLSTVGSSETIRKTPESEPSWLIQQDHSLYTHAFDWSSVKHHLPQHIKTYSPEFLSWFVGFSEGDGSFIVSGNRLFFTITQKDPALLYRLRTHLGFGVVCSDTQHPEVKRLTVTHRDHIKTLIYLFNGNLLLKKTTQRFTEWVNHYNKLTGDSIRVISRWEGKNVSPREDSPNFTRSRRRMTERESACFRKDSLFWNTSWLAGFIEAEGCFSAIRKREALYFRLVLDQTNEVEILTAIRFLFRDRGSLWIRKQTPGKIHYRLEISNGDCLQDVIKYVEAHPLQTKKNLAFVRWKKLFGLVCKIREEKLNGTYVWSEKREKRLHRLFSELQKTSKNV